MCVGREEVAVVLIKHLILALVTGHDDATEKVLGTEHQSSAGALCALNH